MKQYIVVGAVVLMVVVIGLGVLWWWVGNGPDSQAHLSLTGPASSANTVQPMVRPTVGWPEWVPLYDGQEVKTTAMGKNSEEGWSVSMHTDQPMPRVVDAIKQAWTREGWQEPKVVEMGALTSVESSMDGWTVMAMVAKVDQEAGSRTDIAYSLKR